MLTHGSFCLPESHSLIINSSHIYRTVCYFVSDAVLGATDNSQRVYGSDRPEGSAKKYA
jgi:hypothetical protein